jgi:hypothetical protein
LNHLELYLNICFQAIFYKNIHMIHLYIWNTYWKCAHCGPIHLKIHKYSGKTYHDLLLRLHYWHFNLFTWNIFLLYCCDSSTSKHADSAILSSWNDVITNLEITQINSYSQPYFSKFWIFICITNNIYYQTFTSAVKIRALISQEGILIKMKSTDITYVE